MNKISQKTIKSVNYKKIFTAILQNPGISRSEIAKNVRLSKPTVSSAIEYLQDSGFVFDRGKDFNYFSSGRKPNNLFVSETNNYTVVVYWYPYRMTASLVSLQGLIKKKIERRIDNKLDYVSIMQSMINELIHSYKNNIIGACAIIPAMISSEKKSIYSTYLGFDEIDAKYIYAQISSLNFPFHLSVLNDTACYAYAEKVYSTIKKDSFVYIYFDKGIGACVFHEGKMLGQASGTLTQFGHLSINPKGKPCACGNRGCIENEFNMENLNELYHLSGGEKSISIESYLDLGNLSSLGDRAAIKTISILAEILSQAIRNIICFINPTTIVLGGNCTEMGTLFIDEVNSCVKNRSFKQMSEKTLIRCSCLVGSFVFSGAMRYYLDTYYNFTQNPESKINFG